MCFARIPPDHQRQFYGTSPVRLLSVNGDGELRGRSDGAHLDLDRDVIAGRDTGGDDDAQQVHPGELPREAGELDFGGDALDEDHRRGHSDARGVLRIDAVADGRRDRAEAVGVDQDYVADVGRVRLTPSIAPAAAVRFPSALKTIACVVQVWKR